MTESVAVLSTCLLRESDDPTYSRLRQLLPEHGIDVHTCVLADLFPDDGHIDFGVVVSADRAVHTFELLHGRKGDLNTQIATAILWQWTDITGSWRDSPYRREVADAMELIDADSL